MDSFQFVGHPVLMWHTSCQIECGKLSGRAPAIPRGTPSTQASVFKCEPSPYKSSIKVRSVIGNCIELLLYLTNISRGKAFPSAMQPALLGCKWSPLS